MQSLLFICVFSTLHNVCLLFYINTLWLYPKNKLRRLIATLARLTPESTTRLVRVLR